MRARVTLNRNRSRICDIRDAPAGTLCEILSAYDRTMEGEIVSIPFCTNQAVTILGRPIASTDKYLDIKTVRVLEKGEIITLEIL